MKTEDLPAVIQAPAIRQAEEVHLPAVAVQSARAYIAASVADNTSRAYGSQWRGFVAWCDLSGLSSLPAAVGTVAAYLAHMADSGKKAATIDSARAAIRKAHEVAGLEDVTAAALVKQALKGIRRAKGTAPVQKAPLLTADLCRLLEGIPADTLKGKRDRALLLVGFATGSRRSELVALQVEDVEESPEGIRVTLRRSKTDQEGRGILKGVVRGLNPATCPVTALLEWLQAAGITSGPIFRHVTKGGVLGESLTAQSVALVVKAAAGRVKLDKGRYSGHSLRAGLVTQAAKNGVSVGDIMRQTGHRSTETVNRYIRKANVFEDNASARLGL